MGAVVNKQGIVKNGERKRVLPFSSILIFVLFALTIVCLAWYFIYVYLIASFPDDVIAELKFLYGTLFFQDVGDYFMDFFNINFMVSDGNPYYVEGDVGGGSSYPPLILLIARIFQFISGTAESGRELRLTVGGIISGVLYQSLVLVGFGVLLFGWAKKNDVPVLERILLFIALFFSAPFLFLFDRGNYLMLAIIFTGIFFLWKGEEIVWKKEVAFVALACAVGCKLYPAIFAFLLLRDKDYKGFGKVVIYSILLGFLPFLFFTYGFKNVVYFLQNLFRFSSDAFVFEIDGVPFCTGYSNDVSIINLVNVLYMAMAGKTCFEIPTAIGVVGKVLTVLIFALILCGTFFAKKQEDAILFVSGALILLPSPSFVYTNAMIVIPFLAFLVKAKKDVRSIVTFLLFLCVLLPVDSGYLLQKWSHGLQHGYSVANLIEGLAVLALCIYRFVLVMIDRIGVITHVQVEATVS